MAFQIIGGIQYAKELVNWSGEVKIPKDEIVDLFKSISYVQEVTDTEKLYLEYIRKNFEFTEAALKGFGEAKAKL